MHIFRKFFLTEAYRLMVAYSSSESFSLPEVSDEDGHPVLTFTNSLGQVLLIRNFSGGNADPLDTYYVYDGHGMLCWVLPPLAADALATDGTYSWKSNEIDRYAYYYRYDGRQQLIVKKLPGAERIETIYDLAGRVVLIEDGNLRAQRRMQYFYYDVFGNVREMGLCSLLPHQTLDYYRNYISRNRFAVQGPTASSYMEERKGLNVIENVTPLQYYWYDTYDFLSSPGFSGNPNFTASTENAKGKLTGSQVTVFGSSDVIRTVYHYDRKGRLSKTTSNNLVGGYDIETLTYTFTNQIKTKERIHTSSRLTSAQTELYTYTYDDWGKLLTTTHKLNSNPAVTLASYTYDALGRAKEKKINNASYVTSYGYNIRSWLNSITSPKFNQTIYYHSPVGTNNPTGYFNGCISRMIWKAGNEETWRGYQFTYNGINRLTSSVYGEGIDLANNPNRYTENMVYDKMGNILSIKRYGKLTNTSFGLIDDLSLSYTGNHLQKVTDAVVSPITTPDIMHFIDGSNVATEYEYDSNGNLISDLNKGISRITYNILNLPSMISFNNGDSIFYKYDTNGKKMQVVHKLGSQITTTDYVGNRIYENGTLSQLLTEEGYLTFASATPTYHYNLVDHQGNNRVVIHQNGTIEQVNHYYPFGCLMAESTGANVQSRKYGAKELDSKSGLNLYDYGARYYDAILGRWNHIDPQSEKKPGFSPYVYCSNTPTNRIDPNGLTDYWALDRERGILYLGTDGNDNKENRLSQMSYKESKMIISALKRIINNEASEQAVNFLSTFTMDFQIQSESEQEMIISDLRSSQKDTGKEHGRLMVLTMNQKNKKATLTFGEKVKGNEEGVELVYPQPAYSNKNDGEGNKVVIVGGVHTHDHDFGLSGNRLEENRYKGYNDSKGVVETGVPWYVVGPTAIHVGRPRNEGRSEVVPTTNLLLDLLNRNGK